MGRPPKLTIHQRQEALDFRRSPPLVRRRVAVIAATGGALSGLAAEATTSSIPIVFNVGDSRPYMPSILFRL
jgi:hypothetical protein